MNYDYTVKAWVNGECVYDSTKGGLQKYKTTNINKAPKFIKGDYDLSIHGNKIVLVDNSNGTTIEKYCKNCNNFISSEFRQKQTQAQINATTNAAKGYVNLVKKNINSFDDYDD